MLIKSLQSKTEDQWSFTFSESPSSPLLSSLCMQRERAKTNLHQFIDVLHFCFFTSQGSMATPSLATPSIIEVKPWGRGPLQQSELASVFDKNVKGVSMATPGHRRGGQRTPFTFCIKMYADSDWTLVQ
jgi:hypothetical protein